MHVDIAAITRRLNANGGDGVFLIVKATGVKDSPNDLMEDVDHAIVTANNALTHEGDEVVFGANLLASSQGPVLNLDWPGSDEQNQEWLDILAAELAQRGRAGTITAAPHVNYPRAIGKIADPWLTAQMAFTLSDSATYGYPPLTWLVDPEVTDQICDHAVRWARLQGATAYVSEETFQFTVNDPDPSRVFAKAIERTALAELSYLTRPPFRGAAIGTGPLGLVGYQMGADGEPWQDFVDPIREALVFHGPRLDLGIVRPFSPMIPTAFLHWGVPELPYADGVEVSENRHLFASYVPDAHGIQILTRTHLDKANDLSAWSTRALNNGRYLVEARDLEPWYTGIGVVDARPLPHPDPEILATARRDFGAMILTHEVLEADPTAWIRGRPHRPVIHEKPTRRRPA